MESTVAILGLDATVAFDEVCPDRLGSAKNSINAEMYGQLQAAQIWVSFSYLCSQHL